ncbi:acidic mammalian chitinase-like [Clarias magur]|uniref:Acidic mammalian chitinase-like n=1 Tax=Clarias magur TaxID=1594786 RepID=A0A8J4X3M0_CLAMG|nr:acidic mammalian chitinase-like [Clarias magur]
MGFATYGRTFKLSSSSVSGLGAPSSGPGPAGNYTREAGMLAYYEVCTQLSGVSQKSNISGKTLPGPRISGN